jgi:PAS domain S-box-containing protein
MRVYRRDVRLAVDMTQPDGWAKLFATAFKTSRNAMVLADDRRRIIDVNAALVKLIGYKRNALIGRHVWDFVAAGPLLSPEQWAGELAVGEFTGEASIISADGSITAVQWGAATEVISGQRHVLFVALSTSRWGERFRRELSDDAEQGTLSAREAQIVHLVALGATGPEIADDLHIAHDTVRTHVRNAMAKLGARSRAHLVAKALGEGHALA